jgi:DNA-directed RNA polymerase specialized sigma24 family protein
MSAGVSMERNRKDLSEAIMDVLESWPELDRQVFTKSHYRGESAESISSSEGLSVSEVRMILDLCNRRLRQSLTGFRRGALNQLPCSDRCDGKLAPTDYLC